MTTTPTMLWIDLETTGLDARTEIPLELGLATSDDYGNIIESAKWLIHDDTADFKMKVANAAAHPIVGPMHEKSGLWNDLANRSVLPYHSIIETDQLAAHWVKERGAEKLPLAGSSIGSLDRPFVLEHFPDLNETIHYRNIDISTLKELCRRLNPVLYTRLTEEWEGNAWVRKEAHRVLDDIVDSINEYRGYVDNFLMVGE